ncbi:hypothetical protein VPH35_062364 [Triticum aestivum]
MGSVKEGSLKKLCSHHVVPFLVGGILPTVLLFVLASDRVGEQLSGVSGSWLRNTNGRTAGAAPAPLEHADIAHLLNHTLIIAVDPVALALSEVFYAIYSCYLHEVTSANVSSANHFMTKSYLELIWARLDVPQRVLQLGYNYLFTDVDVMWLRNPFRQINLYADMAISTDGFNGNGKDMRNEGNGGFYYISSTNRTVEMLNRWRSARPRFPSEHDQGVLNKIKADIAAGELRIKFFHGEMDKVCTIHAICCIGLENKVHDLRNLAADWKNYMSLAPTEKRSGRHRWTSPNRCKASMRKH